METLEGTIKQERDDRVQSLAEQLEPIRAEQKAIEDSIVAERNARVTKERELIEILHKESLKV